MKEEASLTQKFQNIFFNKYISYICICYNQLQANKLDKLDETDKFLETNELLKVTHEETGDR